MGNAKILTLLEKERDSLFEKLKDISVSRLYKELYDDIEAGRVPVLGNGKEDMVSDLEKLSKDTSLDSSFKKKVTQYLSLDNDALIIYFQNEFERVLNEIMISGKQDEIQALFIEYNDYENYTSSVACYGRQEYPVIEEPRYITGEYDYNKRILLLDNGINFQPAWIDCEEFGDMDYLHISSELEELFKLHSRTLLHKALDNLNIKITLFRNRPFSFYINEHGCEVMMLYRLT
jgi:hypothetical protein